MCFPWYFDNCKGYKCLAISSKVYASRHVIFDEFSFPYKDNFGVYSQSECSSPSQIPSISLILKSHSGNAPYAHAHFALSLLLPYWILGSSLRIPRANQSLLQM